MIEGWEDRIAEAQALTNIRAADGQILKRIRYGDEPDDWGANERPCHDCAVTKGQLHVPGCDVERCPACSGQLISCDCDPYEEMLGPVQ